MAKRPKGQNKKDTKVTTLRHLKLREQILDLRISQGKGYPEIAKIVDADPMYCHRIVTEHLEEARERLTDKTEHMVLMDIRRLDEAIGVAYNKILIDRDMKAATAMATLMARKAALLGADKAVKLEVDSKKAYIELSPDVFKPAAQSAA